MTTYLITFSRDSARIIRARRVRRGWWRTARRRLFRPRVFGWDISAPQPGESILQWLHRTALGLREDNLDEVQQTYRRARMAWRRAEMRYRPEGWRYHHWRRWIFATARQRLLAMHIPWKEADAIAADAVGQR